MKQVKALRGALREKLSNKQVWAFFALACFLTGMAWSWLSFLLERQSIVIAFRSMLYAKYWLTALLFFLLTAFFSLLTGHLLAGGLLGGLPLLLLGVVNAYKLAIAGVPLTVNDLALAGKLGAIMDLNAQSLAPSRNTVLALLGIVLWSLVLWFFARPLALPGWRLRLPISLAPLALAVGVFWFGLDPLVLSQTGYPMSAGLLSQGTVNAATGFPIGLLRSWRLRAQFIRPVSDAQLATMLDQAEDELGPAAPASNVRANVILILSESFFDVTELEGVHYDADPIPEFHALEKEGVSGAFHTRTLGYGTCNIELELLTGINTRLTYDDDLATAEPELFTHLPSIPQLLKNEGYRTVMLHMYNDAIYNRQPKLEALGFMERYFTADFAPLDPQASAEDKDAYWAYLAQYVAGKYYSDAYMTDLLISLYEQKPQGTPLFVYAASMENHTPYDADKYDTLDVACSGPLSQAELATLTTFSQGCADASRALGALCDYFRTQDEPTVILFFGDHRPGLSVTGSEGVYEALYAAAGDWSGFATAEQIAQLRTTDYLIWANDPALLPAPAGTVRDASSNYFGLDVLDAAGVQKPLYWRLLEQLRQTRVIDSVEYSMGVDGAVSLVTPTQGEDYERLSRLSAVFLKCLYSDSPLTQRLWQ